MKKIFDVFCRKMNLKFTSRSPLSPRSLFPVPRSLLSHPPPVPRSLFPVPSSRGFTLVEMLVVVAMLAILLGALTTSFSKARRRAMIAKATQDVREMTNAILAYENYAPGRTLSTVAKGSWQDAEEGSLGMILGNATTESGAQVPVLYNAQLTSGRILDPWRRPYQFIIKSAGTISPNSSSTYMTAPSLPNYYRLTDEERE